MGHGARRGAPWERILIVEDGDAGPSAAVLPVLDSLRVADRRVEWLARGWRRIEVERLAAEGFDRQTLEYALLGTPGRSTAGATRNAIFLATADAPVCSFDDDLLPRLVEPPGAGREWRRVEGDVSEYWFFTSDAQARRFMAGAHSLDWWAMLDEALVQGSSGRVAAASFGLCGDLGTTSSLPFLLPRPESFARIVGDERGYVAARETRLGVRSVAQPVLGRGHGWIPACVGFDGGLQAPFVPVARGQGAIFGVTSRLTVGARLARLPHAMLHRCIRPATATDDAVHMPIGRMLHAILSRLGRVSGADAATRMRELGRRLGELASLSAGTRRDFLEELADARCFAVRQAMMLRIESRGRRAPRWAADAAGFLQRLRRGRDAQDRDVPIELRGLGPDRGRKAFWEHLERFSRVLAVWPDVWESCRQARRRERARSKIAAGE